MLIIFKISLCVLDFWFLFYHIIIDGLPELLRFFGKKVICNPDFRWEEEGAASGVAPRNWAYLQRARWLLHQDTGLKGMVEWTNAYDMILGVTSSQNIKLGESRFFIKSITIKLSF